VPSETEKPALDAQSQHWQGMLESKPEMFGRDPSEPARRAAADLEAAGARRILELGGGQGRDSLFFAAEGPRDTKGRVDLRLRWSSRTNSTYGACGYMSDQRCRACLPRAG
jgi:hypothetical protein